MPKAPPSTYLTRAKPGRKPPVLTPIQEIVRKEQKVQFNSLCQRQRREVVAIKANAEYSAVEKEEAIKDVKERIQVEKERVKLQNQIMVSHGLTEEVYADAKKLKSFRNKLIHKHTAEERRLLAEVREGKGMEALEYESDVELDEGMADEEQYEMIQGAMKELLEGMDKLSKGGVEVAEVADDKDEGDEESIGSEDEDDESEEDSEEEDEEEDEGESEEETK